MVKWKHAFLTLFTLSAISLFPLNAFSLSANTDDTELYTAALTVNNVTHELFKPGDTRAPQPFYKDFCKNEHSVPYSDAKGNATLWYNKKTNQLWFAFSYTGLSGSPIMMHFHLGKSGQHGPIVQTICGQPPPNNPALGSSRNALVKSVCPKGTSGFILGHYTLNGNSSLKLTRDDEIKTLENSGLYLNIHTCLNEQGELRGQIKPLN